MYVSDSHIHILDILELETCKCTARELVWGGFGGGGEFCSNQDFKWCSLVLLCSNCFHRKYITGFMYLFIKKRKNYKY